MNAAAIKYEPGEIRDKFTSQISALGAAAWDLDSTTKEQACFCKDWQPIVW